MDHISDINLPYTEHSRRYLLSEGVRKEHIFVTGSPMQEVLREHMDRIDASDVLSRLELEEGKYFIVSAHREEGKYFIVSAHREENIDNEANFLSLMNALNGIAEWYQMPRYCIVLFLKGSRKFLIAHFAYLEQIENTCLSQHGIASEILIV